MGAHSLPSSSRTDAGRIAGVGVLAALSLAGGAGVASAHGTAPGDGSDDENGDGHRSQTVSRTDDSATQPTADPDGLCGVLGDVGLPGLDCTGDGGSGAASRGHDDGGQSSVTPASVLAPGASDATQRSSDRTSPATTPPSSGDGSPSSTPSSAPSSPATGSTPSTAGSTQKAGNQGASSSSAAPKTSGNPVDAPGRPGTTRTLPIGG